MNFFHAVLQVQNHSYNYGFRGIRMHTSGHMHAAWIELIIGHAGTTLKLKSVCIYNLHAWPWEIDWRFDHSYMNGS